MKVKIDARGLACPKPVILTKKEIDKGSKHIVTIVDNEIAKENVTKLISNMSFNFHVEKNDGDFFINFETDQTTNVNEAQMIKPELDDLVLYVSSSVLGDGSKELGEALIKGYFYTLTEKQPYPKSILFLNTGVYLTCEMSPILEHLRLLESCGVEILSCGTCLDYYGLKTELAVGGVTNMYTIVETMNEARKTIKL